MPALLQSTTKHEPKDRKRYVACFTFCPRPFPPRSTNLHDAFPAAATTGLTTYHLPPCLPADLLSLSLSLSLCKTRTRHHQRNAVPSISTSAARETTTHAGSHPIHSSDHHDNLQLFIIVVSAGIRSVLLGCADTEKVTVTA